MALSKDSCDKAFYIFRDILLKRGLPINSWIKKYDPEDPLLENFIIGFDRKLDEGWENVFINLKDITKEELALFDSRKKEVPNSSFVRDKGEGITRIGFF